RVSGRLTGLSRGGVENARSRPTRRNPCCPPPAVRGWAGRRSPFGPRATRGIVTERVPAAHRTSPRPPGVRDPARLAGPSSLGLAGVLLFFSGAAGLVYEVTWVRLFSVVFGSSTHAIAVVLALFMIGLALGALLLGRLSDRWREPLLLYG